MKKDNSYDYLAPDIEISDISMQFPICASPVTEDFDNSENYDW